MAMQKLGEVDGPRSNEEEITEGELGWCVFLPFLLSALVLSFLDSVSEY